jgi:MFS superfamily sulfate permease-like transporter
MIDTALHDSRVISAQATYQVRQGLVNSPPRRIPPQESKTMSQSSNHSAAKKDVPPFVPGFLPNLRFNALSGFLVFLIALPLCLAISIASKYPPIAGIWTAVIGGLVCTFFSNSELTIKGPAAGLIAIVAGAVTELGKEFYPNLPEAQQLIHGYYLTLGVGVVAGVVQILFGLLRAGKLVDFFPLTPVHGLLASIGIIILSKQIYEVIGVPADKGPGPLAFLGDLPLPEFISHFIKSHVLETQNAVKLLIGFPVALAKANPEITIIGVASLIILFGMPFLPFKFTKKIPSQMVVLIVAVFLGMAFNLSEKHTYTFPDYFYDFGHKKEFQIEPEKNLVNVSDVLPIKISDDAHPDSKAAFYMPDFRGVSSSVGIKYIILFAMIGSLESLLSAKAIDLIDPWHRKTNFNRDLLGTGVCNTLASTIGGLPMISEIVRSSANINNGGRTRYANFFHGVFLLGFVLLLPGLIRQIPIAALGAMLVYTGFRLASPKEFVRVYKVGSDQFFVFVGTIFVTLITDLLIGIAFGIVLEFVFHFVRGTKIDNVFKSDVDIVPEGDDLVVLIVKRAIIFSNWVGFRTKVFEEANNRREVVIDLSYAQLVDHSVMEKLHELERDFTLSGKKLTVTGLDNLEPMSNHPQAVHIASKSFRPVVKS